MFYVYRFIDKSGSVIYIGKSKQDLQQRLRAHKHLPDECYALVERIEYIECSTESDMSIKEIFYINTYRNNPIFYNLQDVTQTPISVSFEDKWVLYEGPLPDFFCNSINFLQSFTADKRVVYKKDGGIWKTFNAKQKGVSSTVFAFTADEIDKMVVYLIENIKLATSDNQEQIRSRNLLMFILALNLPIRTNDLLQLRYRELFCEDNQPKELEVNLTRNYKEEMICIPLRSNVKKLLERYRNRYNMTYSANADDYIFESRKHQVMSAKSCGRIILDTARAVGITKNVGSESLRKTYGLNIYQTSRNKLEALVFLEKMWGQLRYGNIITYLGLFDEEVEFDYFFGEEFMLGNIDFSLLD